MNRFLTPRFYTVCAILLLAALSRLLPHPDNFTPITAVALFGGAVFSRRWPAFLLPLGAVFISDIVIEMLYGWGFYPGMWVNYLAFVCVSAIGLLLRRNTTALAVAGAAVGSSVVFYLVSNFGVWAATAMYPHTYEGLVACYVNAIPFFKWTFVGDLAYSAVLFGGFALAQRAFPGLSERATATA